MATPKKRIMPGAKLKVLKGQRIGSKYSRAMWTASHGKLSQAASFRRAVARSIAAAKKSGNPVAKYDVQRRQAYLEYPDGKRTYVE